MPYSFVANTSTNRGSVGWKRRATVAMVGVAAAATGIAGCGAGPAQPHQATPLSVLVQGFKRGPDALAKRLGATKLRHIVIITQENRSFDSMFGTFPHAYGFSATKHICVRDGHGHCLKPYHTRSDISAGGPHGYHETPIDIDGGKMDGFVKAALKHQQCGVEGHTCHMKSARRVMSYYDGHEIPNYWTYARRFALADHFFEATGNWSFPSHLYEVSGWAAQCKSEDPMSCSPTLDYKQERHGKNKMILAWTDITYLLHAAHVSWRYYVEPGMRPDCTNGNEEYCSPGTQTVRNGSIWNPLPQFETVKEDRQVGDVQSVSRFITAAHKGTLSSVNWIIPSQKDSEHAPARESDGQAYVTRLVNAVMSGPDWRSTAIFINWDDWGGLYDNARPPRIDKYGYGIRVPLIIVSPWARPHTVFHADLSSDAFLKLIEDRFLDGQRLNPRTDGRPDPRPDVREDAAKLGNLLRAFNFHQRAIKPFWTRPRPHSMDFTEPAGYPPAQRACTGLCQDAVRDPLIAFQQLSLGSSSSRPQSGANGSPATSGAPRDQRAGKAR